MSNFGARPMVRKRMEDTRRSTTTKLDVSGHEMYVTVGFYEDGTPGEVFIRTAKAGSTVRGLMESISILTSMSLQHGIPLARICKKMRGMRFEPMDHKHTSVVDCIFAWLSQFVEDEDE